MSVISAGFDLQPPCLLSNKNHLSYSKIALINFNYNPLINWMAC